MSACACMCTCVHSGGGRVRAMQEVSIKGSEVNGENWGRGTSKVRRLMANNFQTLVTRLSF